MTWERPATGGEGSASDEPHSAEQRATRALEAERDNSVLTRQGWLVTIGSVVLIVSGRLLGVLELFILGASAAALVLFSMVAVALTRLRLQVERTVTPPRVYAGSPSRVELSVLNDGVRTTPVVRMFDPVTATRGADLLLGPLEPGVTARAAYRLPTEKRGIVRIGPLDVIVTDPFGVASVSDLRRAGLRAHGVPLGRRDRGRPAHERRRSTRRRRSPFGTRAER